MLARRRFPPVSAVLFFSLLPLALVTVGCGGGDEAERDTRLVVIGVDSADWNMLDPMIEQGRMPHLAALRGESNSGRMLTFRPLTKSPILWASICTGQRPEVHGIGGFVKGSEQKILGSSDWLAPAIWDIVGAADRSSAVIAMWHTFPARPINGVMVSDYMTYGGHENETSAGLVSPDSLTGPLLDFLVRPEHITDEMLARFIPSELIPAMTEQQPNELKKLRTIYAADLTYFAIARYLAEGDRFDLFYYYMRGPDMISHGFWPYYEPEKYHQQVSIEAEAAFGRVVMRYYDWVDEVIAEVLTWFPADRQVVVLSDHGFFGGRTQGGRTVRGTQEHSQFGIFTVRSPLYEAGGEFNNLELLDICPTMLALMGLPPAGDMPGTVLAPGLTGTGREVLDHIAANPVPSYQLLQRADADSVSASPEIDEQVREQLRSLGYIK